jgi:transcriptional regulator with XRE-family HTH domain
MSFGTRIKEARKAKGLTQTQLAEIVGVAKTTISGYESGHSEPDEQRIIAIMKALGIDANYLWQDSINATESNLPSYDALKVGFAFDSAPENVRMSIQTLLAPYMREDVEFSEELMPQLNERNVDDAIQDLADTVGEAIQKKHIAKAG